MCGGEVVIFALAMVAAATLIFVGYIIGKVF